MADPSPQLPDRIQRDLEEALRDGGVDKLPSQPRRKRRSFRFGIPDPRPKDPGQLVLIGFSLETMKRLKKAMPALEICWIASFKRTWKGGWAPRKTKNDRELSLAYPHSRSGRHGRPQTQ